MSSFEISTSLPPEIWQQVADYLPKYLLAALYEVNPVFLDRALDLRYRSLSFSTRNLLQKRDGNPQWKLLEHASQPHIAFRVHYLSIMICSEDLTIDEWKTVGFSFNNPRRIGHFLSVSFANLIRIQEAFGTFIALRTLALSGSSVRTQRPMVVNHIYFAVGSCLQRLEVNTRDKELHLLLPIAKFIRSLKELKIDIRCMDYHTVPMVMDAVLCAKFINSVASALELLELTTSEAWESIQSLLDNTQKLPKLKTFILNAYMRCGPAFLSSLGRFLNSNAETLTHIKIPVSNNDRNSEEQKPTRLNLHELKTMTLTHASMPHSLVLANYCIRSVTELYLQHLPWGFGDVQTFVQSISTRSKQLQKLGISVSSLTPELLDCVRNQLPDLKHLFVGFNLVLPDESSAVHTMVVMVKPDKVDWSKILEKFRAHARELSLEDWEVKTLDIFGLTGTMALLRLEVLAGIVATLRVCMPNVRVHQCWRGWEYRADR